MTSLIIFFDVSDRHAMMVLHTVSSLRHYIRIIIIIPDISTNKNAWIQNITHFFALGVVTRRGMYVCESACMLRVLLTEERPVGKE